MIRLALLRELLEDRDDALGHVRVQARRWLIAEEELRIRNYLMRKEC